MKKYLLFLLLISQVFVGYAQDEVNFEFSDGIANATLKSKMEQQLSTLLTAINRAESSNSDINFVSLKIYG